MSGAVFHNAPEPGGLSTFSHAGVAGDTIYVSGTFGTLGSTLELAPGGTGAETTQALGNIEKILRSVGAELTDVVKVNVYLRDMRTFQEMNSAYAEVFGEHAPARITVGGADLALGGAVEIDCVAYRTPDAPRAQK